jgi:hypothetical protein
MVMIRASDARWMRASYAINVSRMYEAPCAWELNYLPKLFEIISLFQAINEHI